MKLAGIAAHLADLRLELHVITEIATVAPRDRASLEQLWEVGVDGMMLRERPPEEGERFDDHFTFLPGSEATTHSMRSADAFLIAGAREGGWPTLRPWAEDPRRRLELFRAQHVMEAAPGGGPAVPLVRGVPEVPLASITDEHVQRMLVAAADWWVTNQHANGQFEYKYWPVRNRRSTEYNEVRHGLAARDLVAAWRVTSDDRYLEAAERAMAWLARYELDAADPAEPPLPHPPEGSRLVRYPTYAEEADVGRPANQKLGTVAVALLSTIDWARATGSRQEDERIRRMATFVKRQQLPDGRFRPYLVHPEHSYASEQNDIVPGQALLALAEVADWLGEPDWLDGFDAFLAYYEPWFRERAARRRPAGRWPHATYANADRLALVQFGPWGVMAAQRVHAVTGSERAAAFGLEVAGWMVEAYPWQGHRAPWPDYVGGYYKIPRELPAMQSFCYAEGTAAAYRLALATAPERAPHFARATHETLRFLEVLQFDPLDSYFLARPEKVRGGVKYAMNQNKVRIDYVSHGMSAMAQYLAARAEDPATAGGAARGLPPAPPP